VELVDRVRDLARCRETETAAEQAQGVPQQGDAEGQQDQGGAEQHGHQEQDQREQPDKDCQKAAEQTHGDHRRGQGQRAPADRWYFTARAAPKLCGRQQQSGGDVRFWRLGPR
jgi:hypothetical protein